MSRRDAVPAGADDAEDAAGPATKGPGRDHDGDEILNDRTCIVSRERREAADLIRFVRDPQNSVVPDLARKLPGRGAHVSFNRTAVEEAVKRRLFKRAFRSEVETPADLAAMVDRLLVRQASGSLGLARKAGQLVTGAAKVEAAMRSGRALGLVQAHDAAEDGLRKIDASRRAGERGTGRTIPDHSPTAITACINALSRKDIDDMKQAALTAAKLYNWETESAPVLAAYDACFAPQQA